jgi:hypothetical protein
MCLIRLYDIIKIKIQDIIKSDYDVHINLEDEYKYIVRQQDTHLFRQLSLIRGYDTKKINELILVEAKHNKKRKPQLEYLLRHGFKYNSKHYVRFGKSASQAKDGITVFINEEFYNEMMERSQLGVEIDKCVVSKYESYRCLIFSACQFIESKLPNIVLVDEYKKILPQQYVRYVVEKDKEYIDKDTGEVKVYKNQKVIEEGYHDIKLSPFDGFGVHTKEMSELFNSAVGMKHYTPIAYQVRLPFLKGISIEAPIKEIYRDLGITEIKDVFGVVHKVEDIDCIWNVSMWKAYDIFKNKFGNNAWNEYINRLNRYGYKLGISKYSHHKSDINLYNKFNYQYLQCLDLWNNKYIQHFKNRENKYDVLDESNWGKIINIAKYSTDLLEKIINGNKFYTLKFLGIYDSNVDSVNSKYVEAILINDQMLKDPCIKKMLRRKLNKTITQMKYGKIYVEGFYHIVVGDIIGYLEYSAGLDVKGCLGAGEFYCNTIPFGECLSFRSPLVDPSEVNRIKIVNNDITKKYFEYFKDQDVCMINMYDLSMPQQGGMDEDGDSVFLCYNPIIVNSKIDKPIVVDIDDKKSVKEVDYNQDNIVEYECNSRDNRIGEITNIATSILNQYTEDKTWQKINSDNVSLLRLYQGKEIDYVKTGFRWVINRSLRKYLKKLPYFLLYNYPQKLNVYNRIKMINKENDVENRIPYNAYKSPSPLNELCEYICQWEKHNIIWDRKVTNTGHLLINNNYDLSNKHIIKKIKSIYNEFKNDFKIALSKENSEDCIDAIFEHYKKKLMEITLDIEHLANYCIKVAYSSISQDKVLCWYCFGDIMLKNLRNNSNNYKQYKIIEVDQKENDTYEFLGKYYKLIEIDL